MKFNTPPPATQAVNVQVRLPVPLYESASHLAAAHGRPLADVLYSAILAQLPVLESWEEPPMCKPLPAKCRAPLVRIPSDVMARILVQARRALRFSSRTDAVLQGGSRDGIIALCVLRALNVPAEVAAVASARPKPDPMVQLLIPVPPQVRTFLDASPDWSSASAFVRHALTEELSSCAANPSIGKQTAVRPRGAQGWCTLSVRIPSSQHDQLRAGAIRRRLSHLQLARVCIVRAVLRQLKAQSAAKEFHAKVQAIRTEQSTSAPGSAV